MDALFPVSLMLMFSLLLSSFSLSVSSLTCSLSVPALRCGVVILDNGVFVSAVMWARRCCNFRRCIFVVVSAGFLVESISAPPAG